VQPGIAQGAARAGRDRAAIKIATTAFVVTRPEDELFVRAQIAFYASTPSYRSVMALHGWQEIAEKLSAHAARGEWGEMPLLIDDEMIRTFAVIAEPADLPAALDERYQGLVDRLALYIPFTPGDRDAFWQMLLKSAP